MDKTNDYFVRLRRFISSNQPIDINTTEEYEELEDLDFNLTAINTLKVKDEEIKNFLRSLMDTRGFIFNKCNNAQEKIIAGKIKNRTYICVPILLSRLPYEFY